MSPPSSVVLAPFMASSPVSRQNRRRPSSADTVRGANTQQLAAYSVPVNAFSGRPPSAGGLNRVSRHVPVHVGGSAGSVGVPAVDSL
jgi:hypothetical protein